MGPLEFALMGANSYIDDMTPIYMGGNNENNRVVRPETVPIHLKLYIIGQKGRLSYATD